MPEGRAAAAKILIIGAGAIGAFYGAVLARAGCEVSVITRSDHDAVTARGYRINSTLGDLSFRPAQTLRAPAEYVGEADYLLVTLKLVRGVNRVALIRPALAQRSVIVLVQNGINIEDEVTRAFPDHELLTGVAYAAVCRVGAGQVEHESPYSRLVLGRYPRGVGAAAERFAALFEQGGGSVQLSEDIVSARWQKAAWNAVFNPLSALGGGLGTRDILGTETSTRFVKDAIAEVCAIARAAGHPLPEDTLERQISGTRHMPNYVSSMGQDLIARRPLETEAILGNVIRAARCLGVAAPRLEALYALLLMIEQRSP